MKRTDFVGKTVFVTGGTSGLGLAAAAALAERGADIAVFSSGAAASGPALQMIRQARKSEDQHVAWFQLDVADRDQVLAGFAEAAAELAAPDLVIHMAGVGGVAPMVDMPFSQFDRIIQVNLYGTRHVVEAALATMAPRRAGKIVLAGSLGGLVPIYGYTAYGASKFGVVGFAQCLRSELKPLGIEVACFCPGEVDTPGLAAERASYVPAATTALKRIGGVMPLDRAAGGPDSRHRGRPVPDRPRHPSQARPLGAAPDAAAPVEPDHRHADRARPSRAAAGHSRGRPNPAPHSAEQR